MSGFSSDVVCGFVFSVELIVVIGKHCREPIPFVLFNGVSGAEAAVFL